MSGEIGHLVESLFILEMEPNPQNCSHSVSGQAIKKVAVEC